MPRNGATVKWNCVRTRASVNTGPARKTLPAPAGGPTPRWCKCTLIWPLLFHGIRADVSETPDNALTTRMHGHYRLSIDRLFLGSNAMCNTFLRNNPICIEGRNCRLSTAHGLFNKCSGLRPSDTSSWWLGWRRHARVGEPFSKLHYYAVPPAAADFPQDVCLTVSRNHTVFLICIYINKDHAVF